VTIIDLLWKLVEVIPENCRLRIKMTNLPYILDLLQEIAKILNHERVYSFLHIPVQSVSDDVLTDASDYLFIFKGIFY
jgi:threonylcarbamoyladenosine tRNA methylthiotransferase CDKAL1